MAPTAARSDDPPTVASRSWPSARRSGSGVAGRVAIHAGGHLPHGDALAALGRAAVALGGPWLAVAWTIGALAGSRRRGALGGGAALALAPPPGTCSRWPRAVARPWPTRCPSPPPGPLVALAAGALFGLAGAALARRRRRACAPRPSPRSPAPWRARRCCSPGEWSGRAAALVLASSSAVGLGLLAAARRRAPLGLTLAVFAVAAVAFAGIEDGVRDTLRLAGWAGP